MYKIIRDFDYNDYIGDLFTLKEFIEHTDCGGITPDDGGIGEVVIDGKEANIDVEDFGGWNSNTVNMSFEQLKKIKGKVEIIWCNK